LSNKRQAKLDSIGFTWSARCCTDWNVCFQQLLEYKEAFGDCPVPRGFSRNPQLGDSHNVELGKWIRQQRHLKKRNKLSDKREAKLDSIGFAWNEECRTDWNVRFQQLLEYKEAFGDCHVPQDFSRNPQLGEWTYTQRRSNKSKRMTKECWEN
jgi:hypothetical protein